MFSRRTARTLEVEWTPSCRGSTSNPLVVGSGVWVGNNSVFHGGDGGGDSGAAAAEGGGGGASTCTATPLAATPLTATPLTAETSAGTPSGSMEVTLTMHYSILNTLLSADSADGGFDRREYAAAFPRFWPPGRGI